MKILLGLALLAMLMQQAPVQPEPPAYPEGTYCTPKGIVHEGFQTTDHPCACKRMNHSDDCDDPAFDTHDPACNQFCHEAHCACKIECEKH